MINHSGFLTRSESGWGSRSDSQFVSSASWISELVRWRMKTGLPRHLMMTWKRSRISICHSGVCGDRMVREWSGAVGGGGTYVLAFGDGGQVDLNLRLGKDVGGGGHVDEEI